MNSPGERRERLRTALGGVAIRKQLEQFMLAFDSNLAPIVGQQVTLSADTAAVAGPRIDRLKARADAGECDLAVSSGAGPAGAGYLYVGGGLFKPDRAKRAPVSDAALREAAGRKGGELTGSLAPNV